MSQIMVISRERLNRKATHFCAIFCDRCSTHKVYTATNSKYTVRIRVNTLSTSSMRVSQVAQNILTRKNPKRNAFVDARGTDP